MAKLISKTYADALFDIAIEENQVDALGKRSHTALSGSAGESGVIFSDESSSDSEGRKGEGCGRNLQEPYQ